MRQCTPTVLKRVRAFLPTMAAADNDLNTAVQAAATGGGVSVDIEHLTDAGKYVEMVSGVVNGGMAVRWRVEHA